MKNFSFSTILGLTLGILLAGYAVFAFDPPTAAPPGENVEAPLNTGPAIQIKTGELRVGSFVVSGGTLLNGITQINGNVGIGMPASGNKLDVAGDVSWSGTLQGGLVPWGRLTSVPSTSTRWPNWGEVSGKPNIVEHGKRLFTSDGTFTVPSGISKVWVTMIGGGGGGGAGGTPRSVPGGGGGGGGGGDGIIAKELGVTSGANHSIIVGAGGLGGVDAGNGANGGASVFGALWSVGGGGRGIKGTRSAGAGGSAGGNFGSGGINGYSLTGNGGEGGWSGWGSPGKGGKRGVVVVRVECTPGFIGSGERGTDGRGYGAGGGGGGGGMDVFRCFSRSGDGGKGAPGLVLVEW